MLWFLDKLILVSLLAGPDLSASEAQYNWPTWRGPLATGVAPHANPPVAWNDKKNIRWKAVLPGKGHSTPIVWGERIYLTTAIPFGEALRPRLPERPGTHDNFPLTHNHEFAVLAVSRRDGSILWQKTVRKELPHEAGHVTGSLASASPVTDGELVFAFFGSRGIYCLDTAGKVLWEKQLGVMHSKHGHGEGSSPILAGDALIVNWDHEDGSFVAAFDKRTGKQLWKVARAEDTSWATPIVVDQGGKTQVIVSGTHRIRAYDLSSGAVVWECGGLSSNVVASPVSANGIVYAGSSYDTRALLAIAWTGPGATSPEPAMCFGLVSAAHLMCPRALYDDSLYTANTVRNCFQVGRSREPTRAAVSPRGHHERMHLRSARWPGLHHSVAKASPR